MILDFLIIQEKSRYIRENSTVKGKVTIVFESWFQWFGIKFKKNRIIVGYEDKEKK